MVEIQRLAPQPGPQTKFLASAADFVVYGGGAGGGKSYGLLLEAARHIENTGFRGVIFRRTAEQIRQAGGLWDEAFKIYPPLGGKPREQPTDFRFQSGAQIKLDSIQYEQDKLQFQGAQLAFIGWDELTHFTKGQVIYMMSRNRSTCGIRPYMRATTNPDVNSWVRHFLGPWLDDGVADGQIMYLERDGDNFVWFAEPGEHRKSVTFIAARIHDNKKLLEADPGYLANLKALNLVDRRRLLDGDWDIAEEGNMFRSEWFKIAEVLPQIDFWLWYWDLASSEPKPGRDPDWTVGVLMGLTPDKKYVLADVKRAQVTPEGVRALVKSSYEQGPKGAKLRIEQEPGSSGVFVIDQFRKLFPAVDFEGIRNTGSKMARAKPYSAMAEAGHVLMKRAHWNQDFINEHTPFPQIGIHDDQVDAASGAYNELAGQVQGFAPAYAAASTVYEPEVAANQDYDPILGF